MCPLHGPSLSNGLLSRDTADSEVKSAVRVWGALLTEDNNQTKDVGAKKRGEHQHTKHQDVY